MAQQLSDRERFWRRHLQQQPRSGLSIRQYCFEHDLAKATFYLWRRRLRQRDHLAQADAGQPTTPAFVPVTLIDAPPRSDASAIDIRLSGGQRLRVRAGCDTQLLATVLALLEGRPC